MIPSSIVICSSLIVTLGLGLSCTPKYALPTDPKTPVVVLTYDGGYTPPRVNDEPDLEILADGTIILGAPFGLKKRIESKIERQRLQHLLNFLLNEQQLQKFDARKVLDSIQAEQQKQGEIVEVEDAVTTVIRIHANGKTIEVKFYALSDMAQEYPTVRELGQLEAARRQLEDFSAEVYAGGKQGVLRYLNLANKHLKGKYPNVPPLTVGNLQNCWQFANGNTRVSFIREEQLDEKKSRITVASINIPAGQPPQIITDAYTEHKE